MSTRVKLHDDTPLDSGHFHFKGTRKIMPSELYGIALGWGYIADTSGYSVALVRSDGVVAKAIGFLTLLEAIESLEEQMSRYIDRKKRFDSKLVAVISFAADHDEAWMLRRTGATAVFMPAHTGPDSSDKEKSLLSSWLGDSGQHRGGFHKHAIIWPRYQLLRVKQYPKKAEPESVE